MRGTAQVILDFLANAAWQVTAIALVATLGNYLLRSFTRARHAVWVAALILSFLLPLSTSLLSSKGESPRIPFTQSAITEPVTLTAAKLAEPGIATVATDPGLHVSEKFAFILLAGYLLLFAYRSFKLIRAGLKTRATRKSAALLVPEGNLSRIFEQCKQEFKVSRVTMLTSRSLHTAATTGVFIPSIILPEELLRAGDDNALAAAVGHELVHIARRDYLLNLIYELIFLPLSFHPAAALMKRRITQTRELRCDEVVAERLLHPEVYARSLVRLAGLAIPFTRRTQTMIVGISDADILEVRIMSLLKRTKSNLRRKTLLLIAAAILLALPAVVAASFAVHFKIDPAVAGASAQEPSSESIERRRKLEREAVENNQRMEKQIQELKQAIEQTPNAEGKARLEAELKHLMEEKRSYANTSEGKFFLLRNDAEGQRREILMKQKRDTELAKLARISMDQAIQIATSKVPGKVLEASLVGERWSGEGELARPSLVLYHLVILSGDDPDPVTSHVLVNASDGTIVKTEREERKRENPELINSNRSAERALDGGVLNGKATSLPVPEYPLSARQAHVSGSVNVEVLIDETGNVVEARSVSGHPLLQAAAVSAARQATFAPTRYNGEPVRIKGVVIYNFVAQ